MPANQGIEMITVLMDMFTLFMQTISALALVYGAFLAFVFAFGKGARRPEVNVTPAQDIQDGRTRWNQ